ncbi:hypothetical protein LEP1GSC086_2463 [Leptospira weilii str. LNT 1234]|nr:hypothetical protein LEP1GSC086_2463 [Leptospira weilii str. LNT 1234]
MSLTSSSIDESFQDFVWHDRYIVRRIPFQATLVAIPQPDSAFLLLQIKSRVELLPRG